MEENKNTPDIQPIKITLDDEITMVIKPYVIRNFEKELRRVKWPIEKKHNKNFLYIFVFIIVLTGFFALVSFGATSIIELIGAK